MSEEEIKDMSLEDMAEEKEAEKEAEKAVSDMSLDDSTGSTPSELGERLAKLFPNAQYIYVDPVHPLCKLPDGGYTFRSVPLADLGAKDLAEIESYLKKEETKK